LIVGAAKSGTTSLFQYLRGHPEVFMPDLKEASFFAGDGIRTEAEYLGLFRGSAGKKAIGEASVAYLYLPETAPAIRALLTPDVRVVIILRNPVDMAYSLWGHMVREGRETLEFFDAIKAETSRMANAAFRREAKGWLYNYAYLDRARYAQQVEVYLRTFDRAHVRVLIFEEFFADVAGGFGELCAFLGVDPEHRPMFEAFNRAGILRSRLLRKMLEDPAPWKDIVKSLTPDGPRLKLKAWLSKFNHKDQPLPPLTRAQREYLWQLFAPDVARLEAVLGRRIDCWSAEPSEICARQRAEAAFQGASGASRYDARRAY